MGWPAFLTEHNISSIQKTITILGRKRSFFASPRVGSIPNRVGGQLKLKMSSPRRRKIDQDSTPGSERTAIIERLGFGVGEVFETKRVRLAPSPPRSERTATERLGFGGGRVLATKRSEPCLRRKPTISGLDGLPALKRRDSMQDDEKLEREAKVAKMPEKIQLSFGKRAGRR
ncbi:hypothetical protein MSAN_00738400 [Mycena sanguinolenta]|uniref:Uncharacterized protein n=1 Tax=Mycena sanguinolenta TaxID=230812 RepID=A0A8H6Z587_9AGAR|nr:hypothetical protein MSAN_00738400 [Mycena sanguinolenta]